MNNISIRMISNDDFICTDQFGELLRPNYVTQHYRLLLEKNGLRHIRFHDLRHPYVKLTTKYFACA